MKHCCVYVVVILAWLGISEGLASTNITCSQTAIDCGTVSGQSSVQHTFQLANIGSTPVRLAKIQPSCSCTVVAPSSNVIEASGSVDLRIRVDLDDVPFGPYSKEVLVSFDPPQAQAIRLVMKGIHESDLSVVPKMAVFGRILPKDAAKARAHKKGQRQLTEVGGGNCLPPHRRIEQMDISRNPRTY